MTRTSLASLLVFGSLALLGPARAQDADRASGLPCNSLCDTWLSLGRDTPPPRPAAPMSRAVVLDLHPTLADQDLTARPAVVAVPARVDAPPLPVRRPPTQKASVVQLRIAKPPRAVASRAIPVPAPGRSVQVSVQPASLPVAPMTARPLDPPRDIASIVVPPAHDPALDPAFVVLPEPAVLALPPSQPVPAVAPAVATSEAPAAPIETSAQAMSPPRNATLVMPPPLDVIAALMLQPLRH